MSRIILVVERMGINYVEKISNNLQDYISCFSEFPYTSITTITDVKGIVYAPENNNSTGELEKCCRDNKIDLWLFEKDNDYKIRIITYK